MIVSNAGQLFDDLDSQQAQIATALSPMRTVDYLMNRNAGNDLIALTKEITRLGGTMVPIELTNARRAIEGRVNVNPGIIRQALRMRTNFDRFTIAEIITMYRIGIIVAANALQRYLPESQAIQLDGLCSPERLNGQTLNIPWSEIRLPEKASAFGRTVEYVLRRPGIAIVGIGLMIFLAATALGIAVRALIYS